MSSLHDSFDPFQCGICLYVFIPIVLLVLPVIFLNRGSVSISCIVNIMSSLCPWTHDHGPPSPGVPQKSSRTPRISAFTLSILLL